MTFRFFEASTIVGANVSESSGSTSVRAIGCTASARADRLLHRRHLAEDRLEQRLGLGQVPQARAIHGQLLDDPRRLHERVVGDRRHRGVAAAAAHAEQERRAHLLGGGAEVERPAAEHDPVAAALVDRVVGAHRVRVLADEPREPEVLADLLVGRGDEDEVAVRPEPLPRQARDRDRARRHLALHVERPAPPDLAVDDLARPRVALPLGRVGEHGVGVGEERERRPAPVPADPRDEVGALRHLRDQLDLDARVLEVGPQHLGRARLVPGRVDRVGADELPQELDHGAQSDSFAYAVSAFRTSHSSGKNRCFTSRPSTSTGVPCVPTTWSPITRATTW